MGGTLSIFLAGARIHSGTASVTIRRQEAGRYSATAEHAEKLFANYNSSANVPLLQPPLRSTALHGAPPANCPTFVPLLGAGIECLRAEPDGGIGRRCRVT